MATTMVELIRAIVCIGRTLPSTLTKMGMQEPTLGTIAHTQVSTITVPTNSGGLLPATTLATMQPPGSHRIKTPQRIIGTRTTTTISGGRSSGRGLATLLAV